MPKAGDNSNAELKRFAERIADFMGQIQEIKDDLKLELKAAKDAGFDIKALNKVVREMTMEPEKQEAQLEFDWAVGAYRRVLGLKTEIGGKQEAEYV